MQIFHMQLHPNAPGDAVKHAQNALNQSPAIGLDFEAGPEFARSLATFNALDFQTVQATHQQMRNNGNYGVTLQLEPFYKLKKGAIGLIRGGVVPVALIRITGDYFFKEPQENDPHWFHHRFPVEVLGWYDEDNPRYNLDINPPAQGTFQILNNPNTPTYRGVQRWLQVKEVAMRFAALKSAITNFRNVILTGPPGTGKTLLAKRLAAYMLTNTVPETGAVDGVLKNLRMPFQEGQAGAWDIVQFHPAYNYDDFIRGIRIRTEGGQTAYTVENGPLLEMAAQAQAHPNQTFILIIDEINRANVAAVLGEMIYALEYRSQPVRLQYRHGDAAIDLPENLYVIGTMNTADRSIGHIDYAVRRRFAFVPLLPERGVVEAFHADPQLRTLALKKFDDVAGLFRGDAALLTTDYRAEDVQPGHSYFLAREDQDDLDRRMKYQVGPLLREYVADGVLKTEAIQRIGEIEGVA